MPSSLPLLVVVGLITLCVAPACCICYYLAFRCVSPRNNPTDTHPTDTYQETIEENEKAQRDLRELRGKLEAANNKVTEGTTAAQNMKEDAETLEQELNDNELAIAALPTNEEQDKQRQAIEAQSTSEIITLVNNTNEQSAKATQSSKDKREEILQRSKKARGNSISETPAEEAQNICAAADDAMIRASAALNDDELSEDQGHSSTSSNDDDLTEDQSRRMSFV